MPAPPVPAIAGCASVVACHRFDGAARALLLACKYRNRRDPVASFARGLARTVPPGVDLVTWAPTTPARARARGFDQAEVLARALARELGVPARATLRRRPGAPQTGRAARARFAGARFVLRRGRGARALPGASVVLVDDIVTTGATFAHAAVALRAGGAAVVHARAVAATPPRGSAAATPPRGRVVATPSPGGADGFGTSVPGSSGGRVPS